ENEWPDVTEYYSNAFRPEDATVIHVTSTSIITGIDAVIDPPGMVAGTVVNSDNQPLAGIAVTQHTAATMSGDWPYPNGQYTDSQGHFSFVNGTTPYWYVFQDPSGRYAPEWHDNQAKIENATPITVSPNATVTLQVQLEPAANITGQI